jgi:hypothetical protein
VKSLDYGIVSEKDCVSMYGFDISDQKKLEKKLLIKEKQNDILYKIEKSPLNTKACNPLWMRA